MSAPFNNIGEPIDPEHIDIIVHDALEVDLDDQQRQLFEELSSSSHEQMLKEKSALERRNKIALVAGAVGLGVLIGSMAADQLTNSYDFYLPATAGSVMLIYSGMNLLPNKAKINRSARRD
jgi:uncharacterized protein (DUF2342 family)